MGITVRSPYSGNAVKVRDQDVGRAVKDEEGRIFYVLPRTDGSGHYGALTRAGGTKDEARAIAFEQKEAARQGNVHEQVAIAHDARGKKRSSIRGKLVILVLVVIVVTLLYLFKFGPFKIEPSSWQKPPPPNMIPLDPPQPVTAPPSTPSTTSHP